jgi:hypothetical protein
VTLLCGPCALIISAWTVAHHRRVVIPTKVVVPMLGICPEGISP